MHDPGAFKLLDVLGRLSDNLHGWEAWLSDQNKLALVTQILRHGLLGLQISRAAVIPATSNDIGNASVRWQDAEHAGVCVLVNHGEHLALMTPLMALVTASAPQPQRQGNVMQLGARACRREVLLASGLPPRPTP